MNDLLTTKQVQELLQVDRTTIYRMLSDGRLSGVKVGQQWRFPRAEIQVILEGELPEEKQSQPSINPEILPTHCVQIIQDVFAEVAEVGAITTHLNGKPITQPSNHSSFCQLIHASESGQAACIESWRKLGAASGIRPEEFFTCHAGLQYSRAGIQIDKKLSSILIAGQFLTKEPNPEEVEERISALSEKYGIDKQALFEASKKLPVLDQRLHQKIGPWLRRVAQAFSDIGRERAELMGRLKKIAEMSKLEREN